jgi:hypothetical protein
VHTGRLTVVLVGLLGIGPLNAQEPLADDELIRRGKAAYEARDFVGALPFLYAYEQRLPAALQQSPAFARQVAEAWQFSSSRLRELLRQRAQLEAENSALRSRLGEPSSVVRGITPPPPSLGPLPPEGQAQLLQAVGRVALLRVHDVGTRYGPASDQIDAEVVIQLDSQPGKAFGFQLRQDANQQVRQGMLALLLKAYEHNWTVTIDYRVEKGRDNAMIIRTWVRR